MTTTEFLRPRLSSRLDVSARIDELRGLEDGWLDGHGKAPADEGLSWFAETFEERFPDGLPLPHLYPTEDGGVRAEWSVEAWEMSLEVDLEARAATWHCWNRDTDADASDQLGLGDEAGWARLAGLVSGAAEEEARP